MRLSVGIVLGVLLTCAGGSAFGQDLPTDPPGRLDNPGRLFAAAPAPSAPAESRIAWDQEQLPVSSSSPRHQGVKSMLTDLWDAFKHLPSKENAIWAGAGGGLALAVHPADDNVMEAWGGNSSAQSFFKLGKYLGQLYVLLPTAATVYIVGRAKDEPKVSHIGIDLIDSLLLSEGLVQALKYTTRRERPDGSGKNSFPSGHAADTFAFATALERHLGWKGAVPAYIFSSYVAISRIPDNRHWLSDTVFGATVGIISGRTVTRHGRKYPVTVGMVPGGMEVMFVRAGD